MITPILYTLQPKMDNFLETVTKELHNDPYLLLHMITPVLYTLQPTMDNFLETATKELNNLSLYPGPDFSFHLTV